MSTLWGIDLGGTKIEGVVLRAGSTEPVARLREPTGADRGYEHILSQIKLVVERLTDASGCKMPDVIGIGTPGATEPSTGLLKNSNTLALIGKPLQEDLRRLLKCEVRLANDANCFALAEATLGSAVGRDVVFGVIMGTGVGGGIVVGGRVLNGHHGIAGEWGHNLLEPSGARCYCGKVGCVETVLSGPSLERFYATRSGVTCRLPQIVELATQGDIAAQGTMDRLHTRFGEALSVIINILDPDAIVLGGGVGNIDSLYTVGVSEVAKHVFNPVLRTEILRPTLGDSAGVFGAAMLTR